MVKDAAELLLSLVTVVISLMVLTMEAIRIRTVANKTTWHKELYLHHLILFLQKTLYDRIVPISQMRNLSWIQALNVLERMWFSLEV